MFSCTGSELSDVRKARKRVRRPSQAGRSRHGSAEGKPSRHHHHPSVPLHTCADMHSTPKYENVTAPFNTKSDHNHHVSSDSKADASKSRIHKSSLPHNRDKIPPDGTYKEGCRGPSIPTISKEHKEHTVDQLRSPESRLTELTNGKLKCPELLPLQGEALYHIDSSSAQKVLIAVKSSGDSFNLQDDRCSNGKHSDSGYDTLQAGRVVPSFTELLKFQNTNVNSRNCELVYPVHELHWDPARVREAEKDKEEWNMKLSGSQTVKSPHHAGGNKWIDEESKDFIHSVESPPKNIVQSRIKVFEVGKEGEESVIGRESLQMKEPLKMSPPMYHPNEAHVSSLKSADQQQPKDDESPRRRRRKSDLCNFVFGGGGSARRITPADLQRRSQKNTVEAEKYAKSVRDLLADFERKSQLVKERQAAEEKRSSEGGPRKRCVFSDTETLLYDTSSDAEGHSEDVKPTAEHSTGREQVETRTDPACSGEDEDDKDDEVAAALGRREGFSSSCRDLGRSRDAEYRRCRKRETSKASITTADPAASDELEVIVTPGYLRLSMAESLVTHEDSESVCSTPTNSQHCSTPDGIGDKKPVGTAGALASVEEYYMPMTPSRKAMLAPPEAFSSTRSPSASHTVIMENIFGGDGCEESSYVEMTEDGIIRSLLAPEPNVSFLSKLDLKVMNANDSAYTYATPESPRYCEVGSSGKGNSGVTSHYEFLFKASTQYEPVYMEVSPLLEALTSQDKLDLPRTQNEGGKKRDNSDSSTIQDSSEKSKSVEEDGVVPLPPTPPRPSLPDILNSSSASGQQQQQKILPKSDRDSSDADDEASKDLDSLDAPRHPRFSLSDTFRPASYYLGASSASDRALLALGGVAASTVEQHDSSDSDLVSPPPIPTSPPPLDDFDNSLELHDVSLDAKKQSPLPSTGGSGAECNERDESAMLWNKPPGPTNVVKPSDNNENPLSSCFLPPPMYASGDVNSSGSESVDPRNDNDPRNIDRLIKRRPVTDDILGVLTVSGYLPPSPHLQRRSASSDLESVGSRSGLAMDLDDGVNIDLDKYLEELQARDSFNVDIYSKDITYDYNRSCRHEIHGLNSDVDNIPQKTEPAYNKSTNGENEDPAALGRDRNCCFLEGNRILGESFGHPDANFATERDDSGFSHQYEQTAVRNEEVQYENLQMILPPPPQHANVPVFDLPDSASPSDGAIRRGDQTRCIVDPHGLDSEHTGAPYYYSDLLKGDEDGFVSSTSERSVNCSRGFPCSASAPVTLASRVTTSPTSRVEPLNNQREDLIENSCSSKRNGIGRKVNAIHQVSASLTAASIPAPNVPSSEDESRRLAEELRSTTVHFLGAANKRGQVDERNLFEADTIQRHKAISLRGSDQAHENRHRSRTLDFHGVTNAVNLYPHGLRDKSLPPTRDELGRNCSHHPQRRSRSLEGLIDGPDVLQVYNETQSAVRSQRLNRMLQSSELAMSLTDVSDIRPTRRDRNDITAGIPTQSNQELQGGARNRPAPPVPEGRTEGDDLWEEDTLWRESLRRVSLRHTRSLDNLDGEHAIRSNSRLSNVDAIRTTSAMEHSDHVPGGGCVRQRISREVTYVNDSMVRTSHQRLDAARHREYEEDYREGRRRIRKRPQQSQGLISDDVAPGAERDDGVHYERLSRNSESLERARRGQIFLEGYVWDEDQETFRKPSASRHQRQSQQQEQQQHFLEDASRPPQPPSQPPLSFEIDREKLRQWDLMSSAPLLQQQILGVKQSLVVGGTVSGVVLAGTDGEEPLPGTGGRQQQQQQQPPWHLLQLTMPHAAETDLTTQGEESSSQSPAGEYGCADVQNELSESRLQLFCR